MEKNSILGNSRPVSTGILSSAPKLDLDLVKKKKKSVNLIEFKDITCIYLGASDNPKEYFATVKDPVTGASLKDATGKAVKETTASGYVYIFSEYPTSRQVRVVLKNKIIVKDLDFYQINGKGYKLDGFDYLVEKTQVVKYER